MKVVARQTRYCFHCGESFGESYLYRNYEQEMSLFRFSGRQQVRVTQRYSPAQWVGTVLHATLIPSASQEVVRDLCKVNFITGLILSQKNPVQKLISHFLTIQVHIIMRVYISHVKCPFIFIKSKGSPRQADVALGIPALQGW
jgi:hypothetical protein